MIYYPSGCELLIPDPVCSECLTPELARIRSAGFVRDDFDFEDIEDPTEWETGIADGKIFVFPATQGSFDGGTPIIKPGFGNVHERLIGYTYKLMFKDPNYIGNCGHYDEIKKATNYRPFYVTETQVHIADKPAAIVPKAPIADDDQAEVVWEVECTWVSLNYPCPSAIPEGIFQCFAII